MIDLYLKCSARAPLFFLKSSTVDSFFFQNPQQLSCLFSGIATCLCNLLEMCDNLTELFLKFTGRTGLSFKAVSYVAGFFPALSSRHCRQNHGSPEKSPPPHLFPFCSPLRFHRENTIPYSKTVYTPFGKLPVIGIPME
jgi:hypothetical protein